MNIIRISILKDNYIWIMYNYMNKCVIIDPGEPYQLLKIIKKLQLIVQAILITHYHNDHISGLYQLLQYFPKTTVYGPMNNTQCQYAKIVTVGEGDNLILLNKNIIIFNLPGHTFNHIGFYCDPWLFCGDTLFSAGCGKIEMGLAQQMYHSITKIQNLPDNTIICSGHEYTLSNINFATTILPQNKSIINYRDQIIKLYKTNKSIKPTRLKLELQINPFLNCNNNLIKESLQIFPKIGEEWKIFKELRTKKDLF